VPEQLEAVDTGQPPHPGRGAVCDDGRHRTPCTTSATTSLPDSWKSTITGSGRSCRLLAVMCTPVFGSTVY
jgi:hypothetical protein